MYPITNQVLNAFKNSSRQKVKITFSGVEDSMEITDQDIVQGSFTVNRYCASGESIEIGSVVAAEMSFQLDNYDGIFNDVTFEGAELFVQIGVDVDGATSWVPFGYFTIDETPRKRATIDILALDRMVQFDKIADLSTWSFPMTIDNIVSQTCIACIVPWNLLDSSLPNIDYLVNSAPEASNLTYRQIIAWVAELTGTCAFIDWDGCLTFKWYSDTDISISEADRYASDMNEQDISLTGVQITDGNDTYLSGEKDYALSISGNYLVRIGHQSVADNISAVTTGFTYRPYTATVRPMPFLWPLDMIEFVKDGVAYQSIVTDWTFVLNAPTEIAGRGETATSKGYATQNPFTKQESVIIEGLKQEQSKLDGATQSMVAFNQLISNALGMFVTDVQQEDGSVIRYMHNEPTLEESSVIFTMTEQGIAWTNTGWNNGNPIWQYGTTSAGDAFFRILRAMCITAGVIQSADGGETFYVDLDRGIIKINSIQAAIDGMLTKEEAEELAAQISINVLKEIEEDGVSKLVGKNISITAEEGIVITAPNSPKSSKLSEEGLVVVVGGVEQLAATDAGVEAVNLTARQYLTIGKNSRFEDFSGGTACFYTGDS